MSAHETTAESVGEAVARLLAEHGTEVVFGIPGVHTLELFRGVRRHGLHHVLNRHEQGAVYAADGYARATGRPGVALLIEGPGLANAATAIAQAHHDSVPLLIVSAAPARDRQEAGWGVLHKLRDQAALMSALTGSSVHVEDPEQLPDALAAAFTSFATERPRPAHIQIPCDVFGQPAPGLTAAPVATDRPAPASAEIARALEILGAARRPVTVFGGGALDAAPQARELVELLGAPAVMTLNGKGILPDDHPLSLGTSLPTDAVLEELNRADAVLAVGTEFCDVDYYYAPAGPEPTGEVIRVDLDRDQLHTRFAAAAPVHADSALALAALADGLRSRPRADDGRAAALRARVSWWPEAAPLLGAVEAVGRALPRDAIVAVDSTQLGYVGQNVWPAWRPRSWMAPAGFGTLGPALPMAVGASVGEPDRPVVCVCGDGSLFYTVEELATAFDLQARIALILWNNGGYGEMRDEMRKAAIEPIGVDAVAHDWAGIARGFGWRVRRADSLEELEEQVASATQASGPTLIEAGPDAS